MSNAPVIVTAGEILVEFVSHKRNCGLESISHYSGPYPSGAPAIFIDQAARMGTATEIFGGIGDDGFGRAVLARLEANGVGTTGITVNRSLSTGTAFVSYYDDGSRDFIFHLSNTAADSFNAQLGVHDPAKVFFHVSASSLGNATMRDVIMGIVRQVSAAGGKITCDPNARPELMHDLEAATALSEVMALSYCLMPSTSDLDFLYPNLGEEAAVERMLGAKAEIVVLKRGAGGATIIGNGNRYDFPGHAVDEIDPTGAGDCFCGTFISLLAQEVSLQRAGEFANAAGAIAVTRRGPMEGNSCLPEISEFLERANTKELSA